jgi:large subunit ribosomal protein L10
MVQPEQVFLERPPSWHRKMPADPLGRRIRLSLQGTGMRRSAPEPGSEKAMALNLEQKKEVVAELASVAAKAHSLVAAEYIGLTVAQLTELRKKARQGGVFLRVAKNTLVSRAVEGTDYECVKDALKGPLLYAFSNEDPGAAGRLIKDFAKANDALKAKLVAIGGKAYPATHVDVLASLPTRDQALSMLLSVLVQPATMLVRVLSEPAAQIARVTNAVGQQKQAAA